MKGRLIGDMAINYKINKQNQTYIKLSKTLTGFTLIEVLMYVAFFTLLVGTLLGIAYQTIGSTDQINKKIVLQQEADFILRKIYWSLTGSTTISVGPNPSDIAITRYSIPNFVSFSQNGNFIDINSGGGAMDLNSVNVVVSNLVFTKIPTGSQPAEIQASFNLANTAGASNSQNFQLITYLRQ